MADDEERIPAKAECIADAADEFVVIMDELEREEDRANGIRRGPFRNTLDHAAKTVAAKARG